jgi:hypothetical protein
LGENKIPARIPEEFFFFLCFPEELFTGTWFLERSQEFLFFPLSQKLFAGIPVFKDSGGFLFPRKAAGSGQQLKKALC